MREEKMMMIPTHARERDILLKKNEAPHCLGVGGDSEELCLG